MIRWSAPHVTAPAAVQGHYPPQGTADLPPPEWTAAQHRLKPRSESVLNKASKAFQVDRAATAAPMFYRSRGP